MPPSIYMVGTILLIAYDKGDRKYYLPSEQYLRYALLLGED